MPSRGTHNQWPLYNYTMYFFVCSHFERRCKLLPRCTCFCSWFIFNVRAPKWPLQNQKSRAYYTKPINTNKYHSFKTMTNNKFCHKIIWINPIHVLNDVFSGLEIWMILTSCFFSSVHSKEKRTQCRISLMCPPSTRALQNNLIFGICKAVLWLGKGAPTKSHACVKE